jgi:hypothetical protein
MLIAEGLLRSSNMSFEMRELSNAEKDTVSGGIAPPPDFSFLSLSLLAAPALGILLIAVPTRVAPTLTTGPVHTALAAAGVSLSQPD